MKKYAERDMNGNLHMGRTIKAFLKHHRITYEELGDHVNLTKSGVSTLVSKKSLDSERLLAISKAMQHDFFQYYRDELGSSVASEPEAQYAPAPKPSNTQMKFVIEIGDENDLSPNGALVRKLNAMVKQINAGEEDKPVE